MKSLYATLWAALATFILVLPPDAPAELVAPPARLFGGVRIMPESVVGAGAQPAASAAKHQPKARRAESKTQ